MYNHRIIVLVISITLLYCNALIPKTTQSSSSSHCGIHRKHSYVVLAANTRFPELERCLSKEYASFFSPMNKKFYADDVMFIDPMTSFTGIDKYQNNVDMLAGRTTLGKLLFEDASIVLHNIKEIDLDASSSSSSSVSITQIQTRWTLQVTVKALPWKPRARFSGVSIYTIDATGLIVKQEDFWDSVNLIRNKYITKPMTEGLLDFLGQLKNEKGAEMAAPELPYELLRRGKRYEIRRYPKFVAAETNYDQRPEGYDRLGSYAGGSNENDVKLAFFSPTIMRITGNSDNRKKVMQWPLSYLLPGSKLADISSFPAPTIPRVELKEQDSYLVAVTRFELAATEPIVSGYTKQLRGDLLADNISPLQIDGQVDYIVGQFDALFSLNKRRNEVWVQLDESNHPWC